MAKKNATKDAAKDLSEYEINQVFEDLKLGEAQRGLSVGYGGAPADTTLYFPLTVSTPTAPPIDW